MAKSIWLPGSVLWLVIRQSSWIDCSICIWKSNCFASLPWHSFSLSFADWRILSANVKTIYFKISLDWFILLGIMLVLSFLREMNVCLKFTFTNMPPTKSEATNLPWVNNNQRGIKDKQLNSQLGNRLLLLIQRLNTRYHMPHMPPATCPIYLSFSRVDFQFDWHLTS